MSNSTLAQRARLWLEADRTGPQTRLYRHTFELASAPAAAELRMYAESVYHVWVNGSYVARGPIFHHANQFPFDTYALALRPGKNVIAVAVHTPGQAIHNTVLNNEPGLIAEVSGTLHSGKPFATSTDDPWRCTADSGWRSNTPKRNWAIGFVESFDTSVAPSGWRELDFDDSRWPLAVPQGKASQPLVSRPLPLLRYDERLPTQVTGLFDIDIPLTPLTQAGPNIASELMKAEWCHADAARKSGSIESGLTITGLRPDRATVVCLDMGQQYVGQLLLDAECASAGVIDLGWSEVSENGRPLLMRKGVSYIDRIHATPGGNNWQPIGFSGLRHIAITLRGFEGVVTIGRIAMRTSEPDLAWDNSFQCSDERLTAIARMCQLSLRVGTQEGMMDCPSREQSAYIADGQLTSRWAAQITGDIRHWRYLVIEQFRRQATNGLLRSAIFSACSDTLIDFTLHAVIGTRDYMRFTGDRETAASVLESCRRAVGYFTSRCNENGFVGYEWKVPNNQRGWEHPYDPTWPLFDREEELNLFIDHPGMGWHNVGEAGIDRRGHNAAMNALIVIAERALADMESEIGDAGRAQDLRDSADRRSRFVHAMFFDSTRQLYIDGRLNGQPLSQISEQTNTWAILAQCCDRPTAKRILTELLTSDDPSIARNGPYFWAYLFPLMEELGLHQLAIDCTARLWGAMLDGGATTLWETFRGDDKDTWCHPWAGAPMEFFARSLLGLPIHQRADQPLTLAPRFDLLSSAAGHYFTPAGKMSVGWQRTGDQVRLYGTLPPSTPARLTTPTGEVIASVQGQWTHTVG